MRAARHDDRGGEIELAFEVARYASISAAQSASVIEAGPRDALQARLDGERAVAERLLTDAEDARARDHRVVERDDRRNPARGRDLDEVTRQPDPVMDVHDVGPH